MATNDEILLAALRQGAAESGAQRLYRSGKLPGLFPARTSQHAQTATQAIRDGLLEIVRGETKGKTTVEWVKVTPKGMEFLVRHESPIRAMDELRDVLQLNQAGIPAWIADMRGRLEELEKQFVSELQTISNRLDFLAGRVLETLKRVGQGEAQVPDGVLGALPWADDALEYLHRRTEGSAGSRCPLPELFGAMREKEAELTIKDFHSGLRRLHDRGVLRLLAHEGSEGPSEPEYALLDGSTVYYYASP